MVNEPAVGDDGEAQDAEILLDDSVIIPPLLLGGQNAPTLVDAFMTSLGFVGLSVLALAACFTLVVMNMAVDSCPTNALVLNLLNAITPSHVQVLSDFCAMHSFNTIVVHHVKTSAWLDLGSLFALTKVIHVGAYWDLVVQATLAVAFSNPVVWEQFAGGCQQVVDDAKYMADIRFPNLRNNPRRREHVMAAISDLNIGRWSCVTVGHACRKLANGRPCCRTLADAKLKIKQAIFCLLFMVMPSIPCESRWLTCVDTIGWWVFGCCCYQLLNRGFIAASPGAAKRLGVNDLHIPPINDQLDEQADDDWHAKMGKRLRRGVKFFGQSESVPVLAFSLLLLMPYHHLMAFLFQQSRLPCTDVAELVSRICGTVTEVVTMMQDEFSCGKAYRLLRMLPQCDYTTQRWKRYMRIEMLRALGHKQVYCI